jgi:membrane carboxypeptidase/penicillin-binding protein
MVLLSAMFASAATIAPPKKPHSKSHHVTESPATQQKMARTKHSSRSTASANRSIHVTTATTAKGKKGKKSKYYERFYASSFANDQVEGDVTNGEDPVVRAAAIEALGNMNGTVVSIDPDSGRVLAMSTRNWRCGRPTVLHY